MAAFVVWYSQENRWRLDLEISKVDSFVVGMMSTIAPGLLIVSIVILSVLTAHSLFIKNSNSNSKPSWTVNLMYGALFGFGYSASFLFLAFNVYHTGAMKPLIYGVAALKVAMFVGVGIFVLVKALRYFTQKQVSAGSTSAILGLGLSGLFGLVIGLTVAPPIGSTLGLLLSQVATGNEGAGALIVYSFGVVVALMLFSFTIGSFAQLIGRWPKATSFFGGTFSGLMIIFGVVGAYSLYLNLVSAG